MSEEINITEADIEAFATRLDEWGGTLSENEQVILHLLLLNANTGDSEVDGFALHKAGGEEIWRGDLAGKTTHDLVIDAASPKLLGPVGWPLGSTDIHSPGRPKK